MISHQHSFLFVHIPKTGGSSIERALRDVATPVIAGERNKGSLYFKHTDISGFERMLGDYFPNYFSFTVVRNPFDWLVSLYEFNRGMQRVYLKGTNYTAVGAMIPDDMVDMSFTDWLPWWTQTFRASQSKLICDDAGHLKVNSVLAYEDLLGGFASVCDRIGVPKRELPWIHKRKKKGGRELYFGPELVRYVEENFADDLDRFGYAFTDAPGLVPDKLALLRNA